MSNKKLPDFRGHQMQRPPDAEGIRPSDTRCKQRPPDARTHWTKGHQMQTEAKQSLPEQKGHQMQTEGIGPRDTKCKQRPSDAEGIGPSDTRCTRGQTESTRAKRTPDANRGNRTKGHQMQTEAIRCGGNRTKRHQMHQRPNRVYPSKKDTRCKQRESDQATPDANRVYPSKKDTRCRSNPECRSNRIKGDKQRPPDAEGIGPSDTRCKQRPPDQGHQMQTERPMVAVCIWWPLASGDLCLLAIWSDCQQTPDADKGYSDAERIGPRDTRCKQRPPDANSHHRPPDQMQTEATGPRDTRCKQPP